MTNQYTPPSRKTASAVGATSKPVIDWTSFFLPICCLPFTLLAWQVDSHIVWNIVGLTAAVTGVIPLLKDTRTWFAVGQQQPTVKLAAFGMCALLVLFAAATAGLLLTM